MKILVIEDEANIAQVIRLYLEQAGYQVLTASDGVAGLELHAREHPDLVILDLMLPALDGMEVCRRIRAWANTPILMLTARQSEEDRIAGLELGADDYLVKPFSPREVVSRVKAILRRTAHSASATILEAATGAEASSTPTPSLAIRSETLVKPREAEELRFKGLTINIPARRVEVDGQNVQLTAKEFDLLAKLCWTKSGATPSSAMAAPSMCMSARCARSLTPPPRACLTSSKPSGASATNSRPRNSYVATLAQYVVADQTGAELPRCSPGRDSAAGHRYLAGRTKLLLYSPARLTARARRIPGPASR